VIRWGGPPGAAAPTDPPPSLPGGSPADSVGMCRSRPARVESRAHPAPRPVLAEPSSGYHHLGGTTRDHYSGVLGRLAVRDTGAREGSFDFVAARLMAKSFLADGGLAWLEAGWSETGWTVPPEPRVYTYDTNTDAWSFYDQYRLADGDRVWIYLHEEAPAEAATRRWQAWLWWSDGWHLLTEQSLPLTENAQIEQYVEVHVDPKQPGAIGVPSIGVDNVQLRDPATGAFHYWRSHVLTSVSAGDAAGYCVDWTTRYDTWSAGTC
jgi:hypothetical protein